MTAPAPLDLPAVLDDLERAHAAATPGEWEVLPEEGVWEHAPSGNFGTFITSLDDLRPEHAALIVAAVNLAPRMSAALRAFQAEAQRMAYPGNEPLIRLTQAEHGERLLRLLAAHLAPATPPAEEDQP